MTELSDGAMLAALRVLRTTDIAVLAADAVRPGIALVRFASMRTGEHWEFELPLPSSAAPKPWQYCEPDDAADSARMLGILLDEEVVTRVVRVARRYHDGRLVLAPYGFEREDRREHERLMRVFGLDAV